MVSTLRNVEIGTRREVVKRLISLGLSQQDVATALGIEVSSVANDLRKIGGVRVVFDNTNLTNDQRRRDKAFHHAVLEWLEACCGMCDYTKKIDLDIEVARVIAGAIGVYLNIGGLIDGVIASINALVNPVDLPKYKPYRKLLMAIFGREVVEVSKDFLDGFHNYVFNNEIKLTRDAFPRQLAAWALESRRQNLNMPLDETAKVAIEEAINAFQSERMQKVIRMHFGLSLERPFGISEIAGSFGVTDQMIRQLKKRGLKHLGRSDRLQVFLQSPFDIAQRSIEKMSALSVPLVLPVVPEKEMRQAESVDKILAKSVEELEISVRSYNVLKNNGIYNIADLVQLTIDQNGMLDLKWCGRKSVKELKEILESMGLSFGMRVKNGVLVRPVTETED